MTVIHYLLNFRMIQRLRSEATRSEDMFAQLQDIQESVRLAFLNCILDFAGMMNELLILNSICLISLCVVMMLALTLIRSPGAYR